MNTLKHKQLTRFYTLQSYKIKQTPTIYLLDNALRDLDNEFYK